MYSIQVALSSIEDVKKFVAAANQCPVEVDVCSGRYIVDAKSIMGMFSIDLSKPFRVEIHGAQEEGAGFEQAIAPFVVGEG